MEKLDDTPDGNDSPHTNAGTKSEKTTVTVPLPTLVAVTPDRRPPLTDYRGLWCWGYGEFGQHGHGRDGEVAFEGGEIKQFEEEQVKLVCCGASHTFVVTGKWKLPPPPPRNSQKDFFLSYTVVKL